MKVGKRKRLKKKGVGGMNALLSIKLIRHIYLSLPCMSCHTAFFYSILFFNCLYSLIYFTIFSNTFTTHACNMENQLQVSDFKFGLQPNFSAKQGNISLGPMRGHGNRTKYKVNSQFWTEDSPVVGLDLA